MRDPDRGLTVPLRGRNEGHAAGGERSFITTGYAGPGGGE